VRTEETAGTAGPVLATEETGQTVVEIAMVTVIGFPILPDEVGV
jgi:hypothetical protein